MDKNLELEVRYLEEVRRFMAESERIRLKDLEQLEERVDRLYKGSGGTFSQDYELARQSLELARSRQASHRESSVKPYFGRIDFRPRLALEPEQLYIGKHSVRDNDSSADLVIDWRAPVAELYYSGTLGRSEYHAPGGFMEGDLTLKRRFTYTKEPLPVIDRYFDEGDQILIATGASEGQALQDEFLRINLEESSTEKLKEIVATIAGEQNQIIRAPKNIPIIVQGAAGAGKTTVALHRLAYLLYLHRATMKGSDVCIIAPNRLFLDYISEVLPDLGAADVAQTTLEDIILKELKIKKYTWNKDDVLRRILEASSEDARLAGELSRLKGSVSFMALMDSIKEAVEAKTAQRQPIRVEGATLFEAEEIRRLLLVDLVYLPLNERRDALETYCLRNVKQRAERVGGQIDARYQSKVTGIKRLYEADEDLMRRRIRETYEQRDQILKNLAKLSRAAVKAYFKEFGKLSVPRIYEEYLQNESFLSGHLKTEPEILASLVGYSAGTPQADDLSAMMYLSQLFSGTGQVWSHVVVDEAQDYSPLQLEVIRRLARQDSVTLVGDLAQGIYSYRAIRDWSEAEQIFSGGTMYYGLKNSYRSTIEIIEEANTVLRQMDLALEAAVPVLRHGRLPQKLHYRDPAGLIAILHQVEEAMVQDGRKTLALVTRTHDEAQTGYKLLKRTFPDLELIDEHRDKSRLSRVILPSYMTKGLEFDCVVLLDERSFQAQGLDLRLKYVSLTRALHLEYILTKTADQPASVSSPGTQDKPR